MPVTGSPVTGFDSLGSVEGVSPPSGPEEGGVPVGSVVPVAPVSPPSASPSPGFSVPVGSVVDGVVPPEGSVDGVPVP